MFCPNCGTKNDDTATPCKKCGFKLQGTSAPKFRGTMMLNSDQSVQEMVDEHRKKLSEAGQLPEGAAAGGPTPPLPAVGVAKPLVQPPRAARRMGTMLGVAPQVGGVQPPRVGAFTPPAPAAGASSEDQPARAGSTPAPASAADPYAGTVEIGSVPPVVREQPAAPPAAHGAFSPGRTEAFVAPPASPVVPAPAFSAGRTEAFEAPALPAQPPVRQDTEPAAPAREPEPQLARGRTEAFEAAPTAEGAVEATPSAPPPVPRKLRPLEVFLVIITFGLYGLVLRARQRRAARSS